MWICRDSCVNLLRDASRKNAWCKFVAVTKHSCRKLSRSLTWHRHFTSPQTEWWQFLLAKFLYHSCTWEFRSKLKRKCFLYWQYTCNVMPRDNDSRRKSWKCAWVSAQPCDKLLIKLNIYTYEFVRTYTGWCARMRGRGRRRVGCCPKDHSRQPPLPPAASGLSCSWRMRKQHGCSSLFTNKRLLCLINLVDTWSSIVAKSSWLLQLLRCFLQVTSGIVADEPYYSITILIAAIHRRRKTEHSYVQLVR